jgi:membrane protein
VLAVERETSRAKLILARTWAFVWNSIGRLGPHRVGNLSASMSYYALLSVFPVAIVLASGAGLLLGDDAAARDDVVEFLFKELPLSESEGRNDIEKVVDGVTDNAGTLGVIGGIALLVSASALIGAARNSVAVVFEAECARGALRGKAVDLALVLGIGVLFALSFAGTLLGQFDPDFGDGVFDVIDTVLTATGALLPIALGGLVFTILYTVLPVTRPRFRDIWPAVLFATVAFELVKEGFGFYLDNFADYSAVYGSLGAVIAFMVFVYLASFVFLIGAEMAALGPEVMRGDHDPGAGDDDGDGKPLGDEVRDFLKGLVSRNPTGEHEIRR